MAKYKFTYGSTTGIVSLDGARAEAPILLDGVETGYQSFDAYGSPILAIAMVLAKEFQTIVASDDFDAIEV